MDELDRKILYVLAENARESHNILARRIRCSREVFDYRVKKLEQQGIIVKYQARINISNFIYGGYMVLVKVFSLTESLEKDIVSLIKKDSRTQYIAIMGGDYNYIIGFTVKDIGGLSSYINHLRDSFGKNAQRIVLLTEVAELKDSFQSLFAKHDESNSIVSMPYWAKSVAIDEIDKEILFMLGNDSSIPSWKIADKLKLSDVAIRKRIQKLIAQRMILGFRTIIDVTKINFDPYVFFLKSNFTGEFTERSFNAFLQNDKNVTYAVKTIGEYNYMARALFSNSAEFKNYWRMLRQRFPEIYEIHALPEFDTLYHTQLAKGILT